MRGFDLSDISQDDMCHIVQSWLEETFAGDGIEKAPRAKFISYDTEEGTFGVTLRWEDTPTPAFKPELEDER